MYVLVSYFLLFRLRDTNPDKEGQSADKEGETAAPENNRDEQLMNSDLIMVGSK